MRATRVEPLWWVQVKWFLSDIYAEYKYSHLVMVTRSIDNIRHPEHRSEMSRNARASSIAFAQAPDDFNYVLVSTTDQPIASLAREQRLPAMWLPTRPQG